MSDCKHETIVTYAGTDGPVVWGCARCSRRFYPACAECVTIGHRNGYGEHQEPAPASLKEGGA